MRIICVCNAYYMCVLYYMHCAYICVVCVCVCVCVLCCFCFCVSGGTFLMTSNHTRMCIYSPVFVVTRSLLFLSLAYAHNSLSLTLSLYLAVYLSCIDPRTLMSRTGEEQRTVTKSDW